MKNEPCDYQKKSTALKCPYAERLEQKDEETTQVCVTTFFNSCRYTGPKTGLKGEKEGKFHKESISMDFFSWLVRQPHMPADIKKFPIWMLSLPNTGHEMPWTNPQDLPHTVNPGPKQPFYYHWPILLQPKHNLVSSVIQGRILCICFHTTKFQVRLC